MRTPLPAPSRSSPPIRPAPAPWARPGPGSSPPGIPGTPAPPRPRGSSIGRSERNDHLAEDLAALKALQAFLEFVEGEDRVDDRGHAPRHLLQGLRDVLDPAAEGA